MTTSVASGVGTGRKISADGVEGADGAEGAEDGGSGITPEESVTTLWDGAICPAAPATTIELAATIPNTTLTHIRRMADPHWNSFRRKVWMPLMGIKVAIFL
jgi:hypothetical protein